MEAATATVSADNELGLDDLGPLAWVLDELRKSLDGATKAMRRFVRDAELARGSDLAELDTSHLRIARQQLHQAVGALEMVGLSAPAKLLQAMEAVAQRFVQRPELCSDDAANKVERASFALTEYLDGALKGKNASPVALFPQYRDVLELAGAERVHPADLWPGQWRWLDAPIADMPAPLAYDPAVRAKLDPAVLKVVKSGDAPAARTMRTLSLALAAGQQALQPRVFWKVAAAFFEAIAQGLCPADVYVKRAASRILMQYAQLARGEQTVSEGVVRDLLFFCANAVPAKAADAPVLSAVRQAYGFKRDKAFNYDVPQFGLFDPAVLVQARKRIATATETWSALAGGDTNRLKVVGEQFGAVAESILKLHPENAELARALNLAIDTTVRGNEAPAPALAMEVATAVLYLEAWYEDLDPTEASMAERSARLAQRLENAARGEQPGPLEAWMEDLYRRVSDRQTMGSVVGELRTGLGEVEKALDQFFRNPKDKMPLHAVPGHLSQMRGVFSVLGLDQASVAALRMRDTVEKLLVDQLDESTMRSGVFEKLGNSLGAMGFLIDMLNYQRALAKKLFVYDEEAGEFKRVMGREKEAELEVPAAAEAAPEEQTLRMRAPVAAAPEPVAAPLLSAAAVAAAAPIASTPVAAVATPVAAMPAPAPVAAAPTRAAPAPVAPPADEEEAELRDIFLDEAREVVQNGQAAIHELQGDPANLGHQTTLRRAFHTLKGSSRMVGLTDFGEAGWALEQLMNTWLAEQKPASPELLQLAGHAMEGFGRWVEDIAAVAPTPWDSQAFRLAADAMRLEHRYQALLLPGEEAPVAPEPVATPEPWAAAPDDEVPRTEFGPTELVDDGEATVVLGQVEQHPPAAQLPEDLDLGVDFEATQSFEATQAFQATQAFDTPAAPTEAVAAQPAGAADALDLGEIDFASLAPVSEPPPQVPAPAPVVEPAAPAVADAEEALAWDFPQPEAAHAEATPSAMAGLEPEEQVKVIDHLRIGIPLYNVYLNEADEWSRTLATELSEWSLELHRNLHDSTVGLAHSLSGSSATVGFHALSDMARALELAMEHVQLQSRGTPEQAQVFVDAAEDIRRLLHQFAAGFLKEPEQRILDELKAILETEVVSQQSDSTVGDWDSSLGYPDTHAGESLDLPSAADSVVPAEPVRLELPGAAEDLSTLPQAESPAHAAEAGHVPEPADAPVAALFTPPASELHQPQPAARKVATSEDDDIDQLDQLDLDLFPIFEEEAVELLPQLGGALRQWVARPDNLGARSEVLRVLHTLKGSARLAGAMRMGEMAHRMESAIESLGTEFLQPVQLEPLLLRFDGLQAVFDGLRAGPAHADQMPAQELAEQQAAQDAATAASAAAAGSPEALAEPGATAVPVTAPAVEHHETVRVADRRARGRLETAWNKVGAAPKVNPNQSVRVRSLLLDRLVNQAGEVIITRARLDARLGQLRGSLGELTGNLDRLRQQLRDVELQAETQMQSRMALSKDVAASFDPLEFDRFTRMQELTRMMAESVNDVATVQRNLQRSIEGTEDDLIAQARQARELQRDLLRTRMVEFESISERLYAVVRQAGKDAGKQVKLDIVGGTIDMDRGVLDRMTPAFEHLLRNSVAHGIEEAAAREQAGKPASGTITVQVGHEANDVFVQFSDDGAGLNLERIRAKAVANGLVADGAQVSDAEAAQLIFSPGFSTATQVTELAGRGIGMDVVRSEVNALGGRIETSTETGYGTTFKLVLPLTTAVTQVVMLRMGELIIGVPANLVEIVRRIKLAELEAAYQANAYEYAGEAVPFYWAGALLQASAASREPPTKTLPVAIFRSAGRRLAAHVDEVLGNQEVVVKNLGPQLARLPGLAGMSVLASGAVVLIYNPVALAAVYGDQARALRATVLQADGSPKPALAQGPQDALPSLGAGVVQVPMVLVVDDSITVRRVTQRLLQREGFRVVLAADGLQALERLAEERPAVILSDIEMPRMDGFDLARNIRADEKLRDIPIIMITSRIAEKHRDHAKELGVNHYLGKPYSEDELMGLVRHYCSAASVALEG
jgi:chemosensory pili system protein ChpA (sensor histidine kinase/response regulator)